MMTSPPLPSSAVFVGALCDSATGQWHHAQVAVNGGIVTLWVAAPTGWVQQFSVPATEVTVKSAAQRITLNVRGHSYPLLADPAAVNRALGLSASNIAGNIAGVTGVSLAGNVGRGVNQAAAAQAFHAQGGGEFLAAMRASGARVSRLGYGAIVALGCGGGLLVAVMIVVITVATFML